MMLVEETVPDAAALPIDELRNHLRLGSGFDLATGGAEDVALTGFLRAAIATVEGRTGKVLLIRRYKMRLDDWRDRLGQALPMSPVVSVDGVSIDDGRGNLMVVDPGQYRLVQDIQRPQIVPSNVFLPGVPQRGHVEILFTAGFGESWDRVPQDLAQAVMLLATRYYEDRSFETTRTAIPFGVSALLERWRAVRTLAGRGARR